MHPIARVLTLPLLMITAGCQPEGPSLAWEQGSLMTTGRLTDVALTGQGYFVLQGLYGKRSGSFLSREGAFRLDPAGFLDSAGGLRVQGYLPAPSGAYGDLRIAAASSPARATTTITLMGNLAADAAPQEPFDARNPTFTSNFKVSVSFYDWEGRGHVMQLYFRKAAPGAWEFHALADGGGLADGVEGVASEIASGALRFDLDGLLVSVTQLSTFHPSAQRDGQPFRFEFGQSLDLRSLTQFGGTAGSSTCTSIAQDGAAPGSLTWFDVDDRGVVHGSFSNGREEELGRLAVALVARPEQLQPVCDRLYVTTAWSGELVPGQAVEGGRAAITQGMLEDLPADPTCSPP